MGVFFIIVDPIIQSMSAESGRFSSNSALGSWEGVPLESPKAEGGDNFLTKILVVRSLRLLRLVRAGLRAKACLSGRICARETPAPCSTEAVRMLHMFRTVWRLVYGLITSGNAIMSTFFILFLTLYIFACLGRTCEENSGEPECSSAPCCLDLSFAKTGVELITKDPQLQQHADTKFIVDTNFRNLTRTASLCGAPLKLQPVSVRLHKD